MSGELEFADEGMRRSAVFGWPLLIALLSCLALILASAFAPALLPRLDLSTMVLAGAGAGLALWLLVLLAGSRTRQWLVVGGALLVLPAAGALAGLGAGRIHVARSAEDARTFAELDIAADGKPGVPAAAAARGTASAAYLAAIREADKDDRAWGDALVKFNLGVLSSPYLLQQAPQILTDCASISDLEQLAQDHSKRARERTARLAEAVDRSELSAATKPGVHAVVTAGDEDARLANRVELARASRAQCELLARRTWHNAAGYFGFANAGDRATFAGTTRRVLAAAGETEALQRAAKEGRIAGREQVREALTR
ncbi:hypothetical protein OK349_11460 [Sphingomonas sp. BT-65]|uniref:hypothetical protein n=1 Tax=Sphingomonas sp. BT-65 TaxID=2989821 RepID=UPI002236B856|nr:hypothetical protein [Sphingomonas sp. BT-65]MCW4462324.1 hypothetical protein [Sphingomonas sp. BT-65]